MATAERLDAEAGAAWPASGEIHLWSAELRALRSDLALLDDDERRRAVRLQDTAISARFLASRCLLRQVLARYLDVAPRAVAFQRQPSGRSVLAGVEGLHFTLSRAGDVCVVAMAADPVGVDVELHDLPPDMEQLVEQIATDTEREELAARGCADRAGRLHELWTNKEAVLKALGVGLRVDPRRIAVGWGEGTRRIPSPPEPGPALDCDLRRFDLGGSGGALALVGSIRRVVHSTWA